MPENKQANTAKSSTELSSLLKNKPAEEVKKQSGPIPETKKPAGRIVASTEAHPDEEYVTTVGKYQCIDCIIKKATTSRAKMHIFMEGHTTLGKSFEYFVLFLILLNLGTFIISTEPDVMTPQLFHVFDIIELLTTIVFTVEYFARVWAIQEDPNWTICTYLVSFYAIVDFLAVFPYWIDQLTPDDLIPTAFIRILRLFRLFKAEHYVEAFTVFDNVYNRNRHLLQSTGFIALILWVGMSILFYYTEKGNPLVEGQFDNIPSAMFFTAIFFNGEWAYCDFTMPGKFVGAFMCLLAIALFAIPIGILSDGFMAIAKQQRSKRKALVGTQTKCINPECSNILHYYGHVQGRMADDE